MIREAYVIMRLRGCPAILCLVCENVSFHLEDVNMHFCSECNLYLEDLPEAFRRPPRQVRQMPGWQVEPPANDPQE